MKGYLIAATGLLSAFGANAQDTIYSGSGFGTYYYDIEEVQTCGTDFEFQNQGFVECSFSTGLSLDAMDSNYIVAMNHTQLVGDMAKYCGKKVVVSVNGVPSSLPLFIGDGCERCGTGSSSDTVWDPTGSPGLDFSYSVLSELSSEACSAGHIDITWEIVDETLFDFDTNTPVTGTGDGRVAPPAPASSSSSSSVAPAPTPTKEVTPQTPSAPKNTPTATPTTAAAPTTLLTATSTKTTATTSTKTSPSGPCATGTWQCNDNVLEQCLEDSWAPRVTCPAGFTCQGGNEPYCAPPNWPN